VLFRSRAGARIYLDGGRLAEVTPAHLRGIPAGRHEVEAALYGYYPRSVAVEVAEGDTAEAEVSLPALPPTAGGYISFAAQPPGARLLIDGEAFQVEGNPIIAPAMVPVLWGRYRCSAHLSGYATVAPLLPELEMNDGDTVQLSFTLESGAAGLQVGALPFDFTLANDFDDSVRLTDLTGFVVLVNFWYVDCQPCRAEFPDIQAVYATHSEDDFRVLGVDPMYRDSQERVRSFRQEFGLTFELLLDWQAQVSTAAYNVTEYPTNILIDRTGRIHSIKRSVTREELEAEVELLLGEGRP
jgi:peroxiredoxin